MWKIKSLVVGLVLVVGVSGCDRIIESSMVLFEPKASKKFIVEPHKIQKRLECAKLTLNELSNRSPHWDTNITKIYPDNRGFETGEFDVVNRVGFRTSVFFRKENNIYIRIKAGGLYLTDLGADDALDSFSKLYIKCINKKD